MGRTGKSVKKVGRSENASPNTVRASLTWGAKAVRRLRCREMFSHGVGLKVGEEKRSSRKQVS